MDSFRSRQFPRSRKGLLVVQEYAMQYYGAFNLVLMLVVLVRIVSAGAGPSLLWWIIGAELIALGLGNMLAYAKLKRTYAEIFFVNEHFSLISVYEILFQRENNAFPLRYANPSLSGDHSRLVIHFNDQVVTLKREDWEEFDLIRDWLYSRQY